MNNTLHICLFCFFSISLFAQQDLKKDSAFFQEKLPELEVWMDNTGLSKVLTVKDLDIQNNELILHLEGTFEDNHSDSLRTAWDGLRTSFNQEHKRLLEDKLFSFFTFQMEIPENQARINIQGNLKERFQVDISSQNNQLHINNNPFGTTGKGEIKIQRTRLKSMYVGSNDTLSNQTVKAVRLGISQFLQDFYEEKGTPFLYDALVDTSRTYFNSLTYDITHLSHEILDEGYFEYHRISVNVSQKGEHVVIEYDFQGKYGSGILFAPRRSQYKNMEIKYPNELKSYEEDLVRKIDEYLRKM